MIAGFVVTPGTHCQRRHRVYVLRCSMMQPKPVSPSSIASERTSVPQVVFVLGGPGSGKGTQCALLQRELNLPQLGVGDLLRREVKSGSEVGQSVAEIMQRGEIVPGEITMRLLQRELALLATSYCTVLIDGFPRAMDQAVQFEELVTACKFVIFFKCEPSIMLQRLRHRAITSGRADDIEDVFRRRFDTFYSKTVPVIDYYRKRGLLREIDAQHGNIQDVNTRTKALFGDLVSGNGP